MKIIIAGYGKMGHEIEKIALSRGHQIVATFNTSEEWTEKAFPIADVVIEFSSAEAAPQIIRNCFKKDIPVISGTTGWNEQVKQIIKEATDQKKTFFYASNFSLGVNIFSQINKKLASFLCSMNEYKATIHEIHHIHKIDAPSGTAISLANGIIENCNKYKSWTSEGSESDKVKISSERVGEVTGTHTVKWDSSIDTIEIIHTAHNRQGFAIGAVIAAEWLQGKSGVYGMEDMLNEGFMK